MPHIKSIRIAYSDGKVKTVTDPEGKALDEISESIKSEIILFLTPSDDVYTHIAYKREYFKNAPQKILTALLLIDDYYKNIRIKYKKPLTSSYIVVDTDEPYADRVLREIHIGEAMKLSNWRRKK